MKYLDYLDKELSGFTDGPQLYALKKKVAAEMTERANEIIASGIKDDKVMNDLVISEFSNVAERYDRFIKKQKAARKTVLSAKVTSLSVVLYTVAVTCIFLLYSFATGRWDKSWLIMVGGVFGLVMILLGLASKRSIDKKGKFGVLRFSCAVSIMLITTFTFLVLTVFSSAAKGYILFLAAVAVMLIVDGVIAYLTESKTAILSLLLYIPVVASLFYVILGLGNLVAWKTGWIIIVVAVLVDLAIAIVRTFRNSAKKELEEAMSWKED